jgi:hypothetical protein
MNPYANHSPAGLTAGNNAGVAATLAQSTDGAKSCILQRKRWVLGAHAAKIGRFPIPTSVSNGCSKNIGPRGGGNYS